jgi:hypothetical protein
MAVDSRQYQQMRIKQILQDSVNPITMEVFYQAIQEVSDPDQLWAGPHCSQSIYRALEEIIESAQPEPEWDEY